MNRTSLLRPRVLPLALLSNLIGLGVYAERDGPVANLDLEVVRKFVRVHGY